MKRIAGRTLLLLALLGSCATAPKPSPQVEALRARLETMRQDPAVGPLAPVAMVEAERALQAAEAAVRSGDAAETAQRLYLASSRVEIAQAQAQCRLAENRMRELTRFQGPVRVEPLPPTPPPAPALQQQLAGLQAQATAQGWRLVLGEGTFPVARAELESAARERLARLAAVLKQHPQRTLLVEGYTDDSGRDLDNLALSQRRAEAVKTALVEAGVEAPRITAMGRGENNPVGDNKTEAGRRQNRRVEILIAE